MPFQIVRNDITNMQVDAIVNTANPKPIIGLGVDSMIHEKAGPGLLEARQCIGRIEVGHAAITPAYRLRAKYVIHTVGPVWLGGDREEEVLLQNCYKNALKLALENGCESVAFPLISTGNYGFPKDKALQIATSVFTAFLSEHEMQIYLVVFDRTSFRLSEDLVRDVTSYIDQHYVDLRQEAVYSRRMPRRTDVCAGRALRRETRAAPCMPMADKASVGSLDAFLQKRDAGFMETLLALIKERGQKNSAVYKKANISKQYFSKLVNDPKASITKTTAVAFALAMELDLQQTRDLIGRAGYALTNGNTFDLIIQYFIANRKYNIVEINIVLYEFDQPLLGT